MRRRKEGGKEGRGFLDSEEIDRSAIAPMRKPEGKGRGKSTSVSAVVKSYSGAKEGGKVAVFICPALPASRPPRGVRLHFP